ncbi:hypothetical protein DFH29DRAFT_1001438 [Suillus ampliporus]|nr:hypothetical protein DFH29DRAFT_1001438 [Suillus ampliporus]
MFALQVKKKRAQIRLHRQWRLESLTEHEFNSSDAVLEDGDSVLTCCSDLDSDTIPPPAAPYPHLLPQTPDEFSDDLSVYSDPSSLSTVSGLDSSTDSDTDSESAVSHSDSGTEADDELDNNNIAASASTVEAHLGQLVREFIRDSYSHRYQMARNQLPRGPSQMRHVLDVLKPQRPDKFRESLRVSPYTFDKICTKLSSDPVFTNNSQNEQIPLADQLAVALYRFRHDGNGASMQVVADWAGLGKGTVHLITLQGHDSCPLPIFPQICCSIPYCR